MAALQKPGKSHKYQYFDFQALKNVRVYIHVHLESLRKTKHVTVLVSHCGKYAKRAGNHNFGFTTVCAKFAVASPL